MKTVVRRKINVVERSEVVQDFISSNPGWLTRYGVMFFLGLLIAVVISCWFISYPDVIVAGAKLNSVNSPKEVRARSDGKIVRIFVKDNQKVVRGDLLGYMESLGSPEHIEAISKQADNILRLLSSGQQVELENFINDDKAVFATETRMLGELQENYQTFVQALIQYKTFQRNGVHARKKSLLERELGSLKEQHQLLESQKELMQQDVALARETFNANQNLSDEKLISTLDFRNEKSKLLSKEMSLPQISSTIVSNTATQHAKAIEINELENQIAIQKNIFMQALNTFRSQIQEWQYKYVLRAPVDGVVSYSGFLQENEEVKPPQILFYLQPDNSSYYLELLVPQFNFGKLKTGQDVLVKFDAYPFQQYGIVPGVVESIHAVASDSGYLAKATLPGGLVTKQKTKLQFRSGLRATAEIITEDMNLLQRFYYSLSQGKKN